MRIYLPDVIVRPLADPRLPLTNHAAERQFRHYIPRRIRYGTRTHLGSHSVTLLASAIDTCRLRRAQRDRLACTRDPCRRMGQPAPDLPSAPADLANLDAGLVAA